MKSVHLIVATSLTLLGFAQFASAHLIGDPPHDHAASKYDFSVRPPTILLAAVDSSQGRPAPSSNVTTAANSDVSAAARVAAAFAPFAPKIKTRADAKFLFVESDGLPAHNMMVGITSWQQQVPLPQPYFGNNAWKIPLYPVASQNPVSIKGRFLRGAVALAVNGIPIFNPQNNRGEISQEIGELDQWGGHCGRADDYHYHAAPLHLQSVVGKALPIAYALDGYPIYGLTDPDGSAPAKLDSFNGHETAALGYHYHGSTKYPYINGGFHGVVVERDGQVHPQPRANSMRGAGAPLRGARITGFTSKENKTFSLKYEVGNEICYVNYALNDNGSVKFDFVDGKGKTTTETYSSRQHPPGERSQENNRSSGPRPDGNRGQRDSTRPPRGEGAPVSGVSFAPKRSGNFVLRSSAVTNGGALPAEFTGDGNGSTLPLEWKGAPVGTKSYALVMDHLAPGNVIKCYWTIWDIPTNVTNLPKNAKDIGKLGPGFKGQLGYEPPHSQGPGAKTYVLTIYALSAPPQLTQAAREVTREVLLAAIKDSILDSAELKVVYTRPAGAESELKTKSK